MISHEVFISVCKPFDVFFFFFLCWHKISSYPVGLLIVFITFFFPGETSTPDDKDTGASSFSSKWQNASPSAHKSPLSKSNLRSACRLTLVKERVFSQELNLPEGVEVISATPAAGSVLNDSGQ